MTTKICEIYGSLCRYPRQCCADYCHRLEFDGTKEMIPPEDIKVRDGEATKGGETET